MYTTKPQYYDHRLIQSYPDAHRGQQLDGMGVTQYGPGSLS